MSRSPEALKKDSQIKVLEFLSRHSRKEARPKDFKYVRGLSKSTLFQVLRDFERDGVLEVTRGRRETYYRWTRKAESMLRGLLPGPRQDATRRFYERLVRVIDLDCTSDEFARQLVSAAGMTVTMALLEGMKRQEPLVLEPVIGDFRDFVKKYLILKKYPGISKSSDLREVAQRMDGTPGEYRKGLEGLLEGLRVLSEGFLREQWRTLSTYRVTE